MEQSLNLDTYMTHMSAVETDICLSHVLPMVWGPMVEAGNTSYLRGWIAGYKFSLDSDSAIWDELEFLSDVAGKL